MAAEETKHYRPVYDSNETLSNCPQSGNSRIRTMPWHLGMEVVAAPVGWKVFSSHDYWYRYPREWLRMSQETAEVTVICHQAGPPRPHCGLPGRNMCPATQETAALWSSVTHWFPNFVTL
ncbi:hypothetical protein J6590_017992 [Homalodisca vitripennis]|nr:hypothetical protein J6590_017992 [Homalodisca vitripennis]